jgi:hypothetical protein
MGGVPMLPNIPFGPDSRVYFVAPYRTTANGASDGNDGKSPKRALKTISAAYGKLRADKNDTVIWIPSGDAALETSDDRSTSFAWEKDLTHLIGLSRNRYGQRCRMTNASGATSVTPLFDISGSGCTFANFQLFLGGDETNLVACRNTGNHNYFENIHFAGMGSAATASAASATSLKIEGGTEGVFKNCVIGLDTIARDGDSKGELWFDSGASRYMFEDCLFTTYLSAANETVTIEDGTAIDRTIIFKDCLFFAKSTNKATAQTTVFSIPAGISQGAIILQNSFAASDGGAVDWDSGDRGIIWNNSVAAADSAAGGILTNQ